MGKKRTSFRKRTSSDHTRSVGKPSAPKIAKSGEASAAAPKVKAGRPPGVKAQIATILQAGGNLTVAELMQATNAKTETTVRTALSDLKSPVYCGLSRPLAIVAHEGRYRLLTTSEMERMGEEMAAHNTAAEEVRKEGAK
jgi:hypothetical protein